MIETTKSEYHHMKCVVTTKFLRRKNTLQKRHTEIIETHLQKKREIWFHAHGTVQIAIYS